MTTLKKIAAAVCAAACIASVSAAPDDISKLNPYGLVYQGAVKTNTAGEVNIHPVTYTAMPSTTTTLWPVRPLMALWMAMPV